MQSLSESPETATTNIVRVIGTPLTNERKERYAQLRARLMPSRRAAVTAGYKDAHNAARLERERKIQQRISELRRLDDLDISEQRRTLRDRLMCIAMANYPDLFEPTYDDAGQVNGEKLRPMQDWTPEERAAVEEVYEDKFNETRIRMRSSVDAIKALMQLDGLAAPTQIESTSRIGMFDVTRLMANATDEQLAVLESVFSPLARAPGNAPAHSGGTGKA